MFAYRIVAAMLMAAFLPLCAAWADDTSMRLKTLEDELKRQNEVIGSMNDEMAKLKTACMIPSHQGTVFARPDTRRPGRLSPFN